MRGRRYYTNIVSVKAVRVNHHEHAVSIGCDHHIGGFYDHIDLFSLYQTQCLG